MYFNHMELPFSQAVYLKAVMNGEEFADFNSTIGISKKYVGSFWVNYLRALYKSGTEEDLQRFVDLCFSMIVRFAALGEQSSEITNPICEELLKYVNYQSYKVSKLDPDEIDWLGLTPVSSYLEEIREIYGNLIDTSNVTEYFSKETLMSFLELLFLNSICDLLMLIEEPISVKIKMLDDAIEYAGLEPEIEPNQYISEIANETEAGQFYKQMISSHEGLGEIWKVMMIMNAQNDSQQGVIKIATNLLSVLMQIESYLTTKYDLQSEENISKDYIADIVSKLRQECEED